jgi:hypothetical protein
MTGIGDSPIAHYFAPCGLLSWLANCKSGRSYPTIEPFRIFGFVCVGQKICCRDTLRPQCRVKIEGLNLEALPGLLRANALMDLERM